MPDPDETQRFDALLDAVLTKPGPISPAKNGPVQKDDLGPNDED